MKKFLVTFWMDGYEDVSKRRDAMIEYVTDQLSDYGDINILPTDGEELKFMIEMYSDINAEDGLINFIYEQIDFSAASTKIEEIS